MSQSRPKKTYSARSIASKSMISLVPTGRHDARQQIENDWMRRERINQQHQAWSDQKQYYDVLTRTNSQHESWTSDTKITNSLDNYKKMKDDEKQRELNEIERNRMDLIKHERKIQEEIAAKQAERIRKLPWRLRRLESRSIEQLNDVNTALKAEENVQKRHEAELKLYQQWRDNHPILQNQARTVSSNNLKLAWIDAQVEKQMKQETEQKELGEYLERKDREVKEQERLEREYEADARIRIEKINEIVQKQQDLLKQNEKIERELKHAEDLEMKRKSELETIADKREQSIKQIRNVENNLFNLQQYRLRLRRQAKIIEEEIDLERDYCQRLQCLNTPNPNVKIADQLNDILACLAQQKQIEKERQKLMSLVFDSEARALWDKHERMWRHEQDLRDRLFHDVLDSWTKQTAENIRAKVDDQRQLEEEKKLMLKVIEDSNDELKEINCKKYEKNVAFKTDLDGQVDEKELRKKYLDDVERAERDETMARLKREEERLQKEIQQLQLNTNHNPQRYPRRKIIW